jgi:hypothetical protein
MPENEDLSWQCHYTVLVTEFLLSILLRIIHLTVVQLLQQLNDTVYVNVPYTFRP